MMQQKTIIFDLDDTLIEYGESEEYGLESAFTDLSLPYSTEILNLYKKINRELWADYAAGIITSEELRHLRFRQLLTCLGHSEELVPQARSRYLYHFGQKGVPAAYAPQVLQQLRAHGHRLGVITNGFKDMQRPRIANAGLLHYFDDIVISDEVGLTKPDPGIFELAMKRLQVDDKSTVFYVGDNPVDDIQGAGDFGLKTIWIDRGDRKEIPDADYRTGDLRDIPDIVARY